MGIQLSSLHLAVSWVPASLRNQIGQFDVKLPLLESAATDVMPRNMATKIRKACIVFPVVKVVLSVLQGAGCREGKGRVGGDAVSGSRAGCSEEQVDSGNRINTPQKINSGLNTRCT